MVNQRVGWALQRRVQSEAYDTHLWLRPVLQPAHPSVERLPRQQARPDHSRIQTRVARCRQSQAAASASAARRCWAGTHATSYGALRTPELPC
eukprot:366367-Chlamydomonas_euryale.AAC.26